MQVGDSHARIRPPSRGTDGDTLKHMGRQRYGRRLECCPREGGREVGAEGGKQARWHTAQDLKASKESGLCSKSHRKPVEGCEQLGKTQTCIFKNYFMKP